MERQPEYLTPEQLAEKLNVSRKTVTKWTQARRVPGQTKLGRIWRYSRFAIEKALVREQFLLPRQ